jgi:hypothetical protein
MGHEPGALPCSINPTYEQTHATTAHPQGNVFVDDFVRITQGTKSQLLAVCRTLLHSLDEALHTLDELDNEYHKEPASTKKLQQGDAYWDMRKLVLGWIINTILMMLKLPQHQKDRLLAMVFGAYLKSSSEWQEKCWR